MRISRLSLLFLVACGLELPDVKARMLNRRRDTTGRKTLVRLSGEHFFPHAKARAQKLSEFGHDFEAHLTGPETVELSGLDDWTTP